MNFMLKNSNFNDSEGFLKKLKYIQELIDSFLNKTKKQKSNKINGLKKNEIILKGYISNHEETCFNADCPLKKFLENSSKKDNYNIQKLSLLHHLNNLFTDGIKKFPNSKLILMNYIQFNYEKKYNLNSAKVYLTKLEKGVNTITEYFVIFCIKQNISSSYGKTNSLENNDYIKIDYGGEVKFKKLKSLIELATKLYGEFWSSLSSNILSNINLNKLFNIGTKLNKTLKEINYLWENDLKYKKVELESQSIVLLYVYFLKEIIKNKKKSDEIFKKFNEEQILKNDISESDQFDLENLDITLERPKALIFTRANEKGECRIIQCSNSVVSLFGYTKTELIGKTIETLMPHLFEVDHCNIIASKIKQIRLSMNGPKELYKNIDKKKNFIIVKGKAGFLVPMQGVFTLYNDDDYSNNFIIRGEFEPKDSKSVYAYYIFTNSELTIEYISSSCLSLGLSMEIVKKFGIKIYHLIRSLDMSLIDFHETYSEYEEDIKKVYWVIPEILYPKSENNSNMNFNFSSLTEEKVYYTLKNINVTSKKEIREMVLQITRMKFSENKVIGYCFRLSAVDNKRLNFDSIDVKYLPDSKHTLLYDLENLAFMRTRIVEHKLTREFSIDNEVKKKTTRQLYAMRTNSKNQISSPKKKLVSQELTNDGTKEETQLKILTKDRIQELNSKPAVEIKEFIIALTDHTEGISFYKRNIETKEPQEFYYNNISVIRQNMEDFIKRVSIKTKQMESLNEKIDFSKAINSNEIDVSSDQKPNLSKLFSDKSITLLKYLSIVLFLAISGIISLEFGVTFSKISSSSGQIGYVKNAYFILNEILLSKYYLTEILMTDTLNYTYLEGRNAKEYKDLCFKQLEYSFANISDFYNSFLNSTSDLGMNFQSNFYNTFVTLNILQNNISTIVPDAMSVSDSISDIITRLFKIISNRDDINMLNRDVFSLVKNNLNDLFIKWKKVCLVFVDELISYTTLDFRLIIAFSVSFIISFISLIALKILIDRIILERERPVDLFFTIRKNKFEELKASAEGFLNKLLNKFYGNEEAEEEMLSESSILIKPDDIMISKFKQSRPEAFKNSFKNNSNYVLTFIKLLICFAVFQAYMIFKYVYISYTFDNVKYITTVLNYTEYTGTDLVLSLNIEKEYLFDSSNSILNSNSTMIFYQTIDRISDSLESTYLDANFLGSDYIINFIQMMNGNICKYANPIFQVSKTNCSNLFLGSLNNGFKSLVMRYYELIRFLAINYNENYMQDKLSVINNNGFKELHLMMKYVIVPWMMDLNKMLLNSFTSYMEQTNLINISIYSTLLVCVIILYFLVWKNYEKNLVDSLRRSVDLINLIPENLKFYIIQKLNEEENKIE